MMFFNDRSSILLDDIKTMPDGYRIVRSKIARTGVQEYLGVEFGDEAKKHGFSSSDVIKVYRSPEEVFSDQAVNGWKGLPVTINHPREKVTSANVDKYQVGNIRDKAHIDLDSGWLGLEYVVMLDRAIEGLDSGELSEVSGGYSAVIDWTPGVTPDGQRFDAQQRDIRPNHLAMVPSGRAFSDGAIKWGATPINDEGKDMTIEVKSVVFGDKAISVEAKDADTVVAILKDHKSAIDAKDAEIGRLEAELADAKSKVLTDEQVEKLVADRAAAKAKRDAVVAKVGDKAKDWSDAQIDGAYMVVGDADDSVRKAIADIKPAPDANDLIADAINKRFNKDAK